MENEFDYRKYLNLLLKNKRLFAIVALSIMSGGVIISYILPKKYEARSIFFVEQSVLKSLISGIGGTQSRAGDDTQRELNSAMKMITSKGILTKVIDDLGMIPKKEDSARLEATIAGLQNKTDIVVGNKDGLITVSFIDKDPKFASDYVNALVRRFIEENLSAKREESSGAASFLSDQAASAKQKLDKVESQMASLRAKYGVALDIPVSAMPMDTGAGQQRLDELILRRTQLEAARNQLRNSNPAKVRLAALQRRLEELRVEYTDNYPEVIKVKADIEAARLESNSGSKTIADPQELAKVEAELSAVKMSEANQRAFNNRGVMQANPAARAIFDNLMQERISLRASYDQLVGRQNQAEISKQMNVQDKAPTFRIVEPAQIPIFPVGPNRVKFILLGIVAGIAGGCALLLAIDYFDKTVKTVDTLKELGVQVLAVIPKIIDPQVAENERRKDLRLYIASGAYFSMIVALLALEVLGLSPVESIIGMIQG